jgi:hypothetical protein
MASRKSSGASSAHKAQEGLRRALGRGEPAFVSFFVEPSLLGCSWMYGIEKEQRSKLRSTKLRIG